MKFITRKVLVRIGILMLAIFGLSISGHSQQLNPTKDIRWSAATGCGTATYPYVPADGQCEALGGGGSFPTLTVGSPVVANGTNPPKGSPGDLFPFVIDTGAGTDASPWANADNTAGIQTQITALESAFNGTVRLAAGRYKILTPVELGAVVNKSDNILGSSWGSPIEPDFVTIGSNGPKLQLDSSLSSGGNIIQVGVPGGSYGSRSSGPVASYLYLVGTTTALSSPLDNNAAVEVNGWVDTLHLDHIYVTNFGVAFDLQSPAGAPDGAEYHHLYSMGNGICFLWNNNSASGAWYNTLRDSVCSDNTYQGVYALGTGQTESGSADAGDSITLSGTTFVRNCNATGCAAMTGKAANIYWERGKGLIQGNISQSAGLTIGGLTWVNADGIDLAGSYNVVADNQIVDQTQSGTCGVRITGNDNYLSGNKFSGNVTDVCVMSGATDNIIDQPGAIVTDAGTRTVINNSSTNAGDPNSAGNWASTAKWAGLTIYDATDNVCWYYWSSTNRVACSLILTTTGSSGAATLTSGTLNIPNYAGGGGGSSYPFTGFTAPSITGWTWMNQGTATATVNGGVLTLAATGTAADNIHYIYESLPSTPWTVIAAVIPGVGVTFPNSQSEWSQGISISDGTKLTSFNVGMGGGSIQLNAASVTQYNSVTSFNTNSYTFSATPFPLVVWLRIKDDGTTRTYSMSSDPTNFGWQQLYSEAHAGFLTPTTVGFSNDYFGTTNTFPGVPFVSFNVTTP